MDNDLLTTLGAKFIQFEAVHTSDRYISFRLLSEPAKSMGNRVISERLIVAIKSKKTGKEQCTLSIADAVELLDFLKEYEQPMRQILLRSKLCGQEQKTTASRKST